MFKSLFMRQIALYFGTNDDIKFARLFAIFKDEQTQQGIVITYPGQEMDLDTD